MALITRRGFFKFLTLGTASSLLLEASDESNGTGLLAQQKELLPKNTKQQRVVIVGGGIAGLSVAESIKQNDPDNKIEVIVLERNAQYFACPMSNTLFGEIKEVEEASITFQYDYTLAEKNHNLDVIISEVIDADIQKKLITTTLGTLEYDYVVVAPGIDYDYKKLFPTWSEAKIRRATKETPAAMFSDSGKEKQILLNQLQDWKKSGGEGYFLVVPPKGGKVRCKPAPYERACMISEFIKKYKLPGKVYVVDNSPKPQAKGAKFMEIFMKHHKDTLLFNGMSGAEMERRIKEAGFDLSNFMKKENFAELEETFPICDIQDVDFDAKTVHILHSKNVYEKAKKESIPYAVCNLIPYHRGNRTAEMFKVKQDKWGGMLCAPSKTYSVTDSSVYIAGDIMGYHKFSPSAQASSSVGVLTGESIAKRILGGKDEIDLSRAGITCFSMVVAEPLKAIEISKTISINKEGVAKGGSSKLKLRNGMGLIGWYQAIVETPFKY